MMFVLVGLATMESKYASFGNVLCAFVLFCHLMASADDSMPINHTVLGTSHALTTVRGNLFCFCQMQ
jgi:hypothetical protein